LGLSAAMLCLTFNWGVNLISTPVARSSVGIDSAYWHCTVICGDQWRSVITDQKDELVDGAIIAYSDPHCRPRRDAFYIIIEFDQYLFLTLGF
jgi:hypothetical protein